MTSTNNTYDDVTMVVADLDGTLLHDGETFEDRFLTQRSIDSINRMHDAGIKFVVETARPVSTGYSFVQSFRLTPSPISTGRCWISTPPRPITICSPHRRCRRTDICRRSDSLRRGHARSASTCWRNCLAWKWASSWMMSGTRISTSRNTGRRRPGDTRISDDVPDGTADKLILFPNEEQWKRVGRLIPDDFDVHISEGSLWMLMNPQANKEHALSILADRMSTPLSRTVSFGDDLVDIAMLRESGRGVAVANANPDVLKIADEICPSNNDDGVAQWVENNLL